MKKRWMTLFLCLCLVFTMLPATAFAGEEQADGTGAEPAAGCICTELCSEDNVNKDCPICGVEGADLSGCKGVASAECTCETLYTAEEINADCPVCSAEGAELDKVCVGVAPMLPVTALAAFSPAVLAATAAGYMWTKAAPSL